MLMAREAATHVRKFAREGRCDASVIGEMERVGPSALEGDEKPALPIGRGEVVRIAVATGDVKALATGAPRANRVVPMIGIGRFDRDANAAARASVRAVGHASSRDGERRHLQGGPGVGA